MGGLSGVIRTRVGYAGGTSEDPTYDNIADHIETVQADFDPTVVTYERLVEVFFASHDATSRPYSRQYTSAIFFHDAEQQRVVGQVMQRVQGESSGTILTEVVPFTRFFLAEGYHQKYGLQMDGLLLGEFQAIFPDMQELVDSTAATRVNAYVYGYGSKEQLETELGSLGLSADAQAHLRSTAPVGACPVN